MLAPVAHLEGLQLGGSYAAPALETSMPYRYYVPSIVYPRAHVV